MAAGIMAALRLRSLAERAAGPTLRAQRDQQRLAQRESHSGLQRALWPFGSLALRVFDEKLDGAQLRTFGSRCVSLRVCVRVGLRRRTGAILLAELSASHRLTPS
jgi:hypothetical protein